MRYIFIAFILMTLASCAGSGSKTSSDGSAYPLDPDDRRRAERGKLTGEDGLVLFGGDKKEEDSGSAGIGINSYLWRATLDTISNMPIASADPFGGVIVTDWYEDPAAKGERMKLNILILDKRLRSDALKVSVFRQTNKSGSWRDADVNPKTARDLEDIILTRARELKVQEVRASR